MGTICNSCAGNTQQANTEILQKEPMIEGTEPVKKSARKRKNKKRVLKSHVGDKFAEATSAVISNRKKSERDTKMIEEALRTHFILRNIDSDGKKIIIEQMKHYSIGPKEIIFEQGNPAECFFVLASGKLEVLVNFLPLIQP